MVAVDLAISKGTDTFHPHKQTRLYGVTTALSQCPQGNAPVLLPFRGQGCSVAPRLHPACCPWGLHLPWSHGRRDALPSIEGLHCLRSEPSRYLGNIRQ